MSVWLKIDYEDFVDLLFLPALHERRGDISFEFVDPVQLEDHARRLFRESDALIDRYDEEAIADGIDEIISYPSDSDLSEWLFAETVPHAAQERIVHDMRYLFEKLFAPLTPATEPPPGDEVRDGGAIWHVCHMFWDIFEWHITEGRGHLISPVFDTLEAVLPLEHHEVQFATLHGIGHFAKYDPPRAERLVAGYLSSPYGSPGMREYARQAGRGEVL